MRIAVLLSSYNGREYLPEQLESLANQTVARDMIVYIRDDGSPDSAHDLVSAWEDKLKIEWIAGENLGPAKSFWSLMTDATIQADYYAFCDQDDVWDPDKLETAISQLKDDTHFYVCNCRLIDSQARVIKAYNWETEPEISIPRLFVAGVVQGCAMVFTHCLRQKITEKQINCIPMHDIIVMLYALGYGKLAWDQNPRFGYRVHENNVVARENKSFMQKLRTTLWNWHNSGKNSMAVVADEMLEKADGLSSSDREYLALVRDYRKSLAAKMKLLLWKYKDPVPPRVMRSFRLRLLLNLF